ncbi:hypothetical protein [Parabacteroides distasonis]|uniref:hypothetical protein n=1 Tax=Parabacteroides distasonis TaxID=823 RepID=UPI00135FFBFE|nr:hypothetical protein [Parabacteroides distasonis]MRY91165.1 hypothetical protein [Parabacteroides distasonis]
MGDNILGCFLKVGFDPNLKRGEAHELGNQVSSYIWGERGISGNLKKLKIEDYGKDLNLVLLEFHVKPTPTELSYLKEIESYRKKEKAIGIPIIVTDENFFSKTEEERYRFLKEAILNKMDLLENVVKKKKLDTDVKKLKADIDRILQL